MTFFNDSIFGKIGILCLVRVRTSNEVLRATEFGDCSWKKYIKQYISLKTTNHANFSWPFAIINFTANSVHDKLMKNFP